MPGWGGGEKTKDGRRKKVSRMEELGFPKWEETIDLNKKWLKCDARI